MNHNHSQSYQDHRWRKDKHLPNVLVLGNLDWTHYFSPALRRAVGIVQMAGQLVSQGLGVLAAHSYKMVRTTESTMMVNATAS